MVKKDADYHVEAIRIKELPFDSTRKMMSINSENHLYTKGAVDVNFGSMRSDFDS